MSTIDKVEKKAEKKEESVQPDTNTISVVSDIDRSILERIKTQPKTLEEIDSIIVEKKDDGVHRLSLPEELEKYNKKYSFCWIFKKPQAIDEACQQYRWIMCTQTYFPEVPRYHFSVNGVLERGDNVLMFRPKHIDEKMRKQPGIDSNNMIKNRIGAHEEDPTFYTPKEEYEAGADGKLKKIPVVGI